MRGKAAGLPMDVIDEAIRLNHCACPSAVRQGQPENPAELRPARLLAQGARGEQASLTEKPLAIEAIVPPSPTTTSRVCREIVCGGNKKGAYLYSPRTAAITPELAGHY